MKRKFFSLVLCALLILALPCSAFAAESDLPKVVDKGNLLTQEEENQLEQRARALTETLEIDIIIVTVNSLDGKDVQAYADDYYDSHGYGVGANDSGILLLLSMGTREWYMSTCGDAVYIFTDYGLQQLGDAIVPYLSSGDYLGAFETWLNALGRYVQAYWDGHPIDGYAPPDDYYGEDEEIVYYPSRSGGENAVFAMIIGAVAALIVILIMRSRMNTAKYKSNAVDYLQKGSYDLHHRHDVYLYSRVSKTRRQSSSSGGGSSTHRSGGGVSHGGRGGRF